MSEILQPCPFCGGKALISTFDAFDDMERVTCENERCINGWYLPPERWNTRPIEDDLRKRIAELEWFINQLIEAGDAMSNSQSMWVAEEDKWDALVKDWKEREG